MGKVEYINAIYSGKIGGTVYARNRQGAYARAYAKPVNPNTNAQQNARVAFGLASNYYHSLTATLKALWGNFAPKYNSKTTGAPANLSGFNTFIAMRNVVNNSATNLVDTTAIYPEGVGTPYAISPEVFYQNDTPPNYFLESTFQTDVGPQSLRLFNNYMTIESNNGIPGETPQYRVRFLLQISENEEAAAPLLNAMVDNHGNEYGFALYMSKSMVQQGMYVENPEQYCLGYIQKQNFTGTPPGTLALDFRVQRNMNPANYQALPKIGDTVRLSLYQVGRSGMFNKIAVKDTVIESY